MRRFLLTPAVALYALVAVLFAALLALQSCGKNASDPVLQPAGLRGAPDSPEAQAALPALPSPSAALGRVRHVSAQIVSVAGEDFELSLPFARTTSGNGAVFTPAVTTPGKQSIGDVAYAIYHLNLAGFTGGKALRVVSKSPNFTRSDLQIGLADWDSNTWRFSALPDDSNGPATVDATDYVDTDGDVLVAVVVLGARPYVLRELGFSAYDEVEDNDDMASANVLPSGDFTGFRGSIGSGEGYPGYDGDAVDFFQIDYQPGAQFRFDYVYDKSHGDLKYTLMLNDGTTAFSGDTAATPGNTRISFGEFDSGFNQITEANFPLFLKIEPLTGYTDYEINLAIGTPPEAVVTVDQKNGALPFAPTFDGSGSTDEDNDIAFYRWEIRGGDWSVFMPADLTLKTNAPLLQHSFGAAGLYKISLVVVDNAGFNGNAYVIVQAGDNAYDETEDNDDVNQANELDPLKSDGWLGSVGGDIQFDSEHTYDCDDLDYSIIDLPLGATIVAGVESIGGSSEFLGVGLLNTDGFDNNLDRLDVFVDKKIQVTQQDAVNQRVVVLVGNGSSTAEDYKLTWAIGAPPTLEVMPDATSGSVPFTVNFTTNAVDPDGTIERIVWDFVDDDIIQAEGASVSFEFTEPVNYFCKAIAFDNDGMRVVTEFTITGL